jgi:chorismate dehydratase
MLLSCFGENGCADRIKSSYLGGAMKLRVGAVSYLNSKPLVEGLAEFASEISLSFDLPSRIADQMANGDIDIGLIPVFEHFRAGYQNFIPGIGVACQGKVQSVTLFSRVPWPEIRTISLDEGSRTSAALTRIILREKYGIFPQLEKFPIGIPVDDLSTDAVLMIGDRAMNTQLPGYQFAYDLGEEWTNWTGLPMVFAVWSIRDGVDVGSDIELAFQRAKERGKQKAIEIADREAVKLGVDREYCRRYLSNVIRYDLGKEELAGMERFKQYCQPLIARKAVSQ